MKADSNITLERHVVDVRKALAEYREASARRHDTCSNFFSSTSACQTAHPFKRGCASFRRQPLSGQKTFTVLSLHISNFYAKKRGIGKKLILTIRAVMLDEKVDLVAGDFNGAAWRCDNRNTISAIEEAFADCALPMLPGPTPLWGPGSIPGNWADVCGFLKPPESDRHWKVRLPGAFSIPTPWACARLIKAATTKHGSTSTLYLDFVGWHDVQPQREEHDRRILLKQRSSPYNYGKQKGHISDIYDRPFSSVAISRPFAHVRGVRPATRVMRASSPSDLMTLPSLFRQSHAFHSIPCCRSSASHA